MSMKLTTVGVVAAAALILVPYGTQEAPDVRVVPAAAPAANAQVLVADVIAAQGNAALVQIRAEATRPTPPDLAAVAVQGRPE